MLVNILFSQVKGEIRVALDPHSQGSPQACSKQEIHNDNSDRFP